jgi:hypothetical protein
MSSTSQSPLLATANSLSKRPRSLLDGPNNSLASHTSMSAGSKKPDLDGQNSSLPEADSSIDDPNSSLSNNNSVASAESSLPPASTLSSSIPRSSSIQTSNLSQAVSISSSANSNTSKAQSIASVDTSTEVSSQALNGARKKCPKDSSNKSKLNGSSHKADVIYKDCSNHTKDNNEQERLLVLKEKAKTANGDNIKASILGELPTSSSSSQQPLSRLSSIESVPLKLRIDALSAGKNINLSSQVNYIC